MPPSRATILVQDNELLHYIMAGCTVHEIAEQVGKSYWTIQKRCRRPEFLLLVKEKSEEMYSRLSTQLVRTKEAAIQRLEEASEQALEEMIAMMDQLEAPSKLKADIARDLLDRDSRFSRATKTKVETTHDFISPAVLMHAAVSARELETALKGKQLGDAGGDTGHTPDR